MWCGRLASDSSSSIASVLLVDWSELEGSALWFLTNKESIKGSQQRSREKSSGALFKKQLLHCNCALLCFPVASRNSSTFWKLCWFTSCGEMDEMMGQPLNRIDVTNVHWMNETLRCFMMQLHVFWGLNLHISVLFSSGLDEVTKTFWLWWGKDYFWLTVPALVPANTADIRYTVIWMYLTIKSLSPATSIWSVVDELRWQMLLIEIIM